MVPGSSGVIPACLHHPSDEVRAEDGSNAWTLGDRYSGAQGWNYFTNGGASMTQLRGNDGCVKWWPGGVGRQGVRLHCGIARCLPGLVIRVSR
jgi:hypothetical protein